MAIICGAFEGQIPVPIFACRQDEPVLKSAVGDNRVNLLPPQKFIGKTKSCLILACRTEEGHRLLNACAYSNMLRRVTFTSFGNTNFDATTPLSVTFIMSQCELWQLLIRSGTITGGRSVAVIQ